MQAVAEAAALINMCASRMGELLESERPNFWATEQGGAIFLAWWAAAVKLIAAANAAHAYAVGGAQAESARAAA